MVKDITEVEKVQRRGAWFVKGKGVTAKYGNGGMLNLGALALTRRTLRSSGDQRGISSLSRPAAQGPSG